MENEKLIKELTDEIFGIEASRSPRLYLFEYDEIEEIVMMTVQKLQQSFKERLNELKGRPELHQPPATTFENAPLALIQTSLSARVDELERILEMIGDDAQ